MIKIYDDNHNFLKLLDASLDNIKITDTLSTGQKTLCFDVPCQEENLNLFREEYYVETSDYSYVIKEIIANGADNIQVFCSANIEDLKGKIFMACDIFELGPPQAYNYCLASTGWSLDYHSLDRTAITYQQPKITAYDAIKDLANYYQQELWFDTKNKVLQVYDQLGTGLGAYFSNELKLQELNIQSSTYDFATVLYPIGKDGLTIELVNNGRNYLENFDYSNKRVEKIWINEDYDRAEDLKYAAINHLATISQPIASYKMKLSNLNKEVKVGDVITLVDNIKKVKQQQRVQKIDYYPNTPEKSSIEIANKQINFAQMLIDSQTKMEKDLQYLKDLVYTLL